MELTIGTLLQTTTGKTMILVTDIGEHWITYKPVSVTEDFDYEVNQVQLNSVLDLIKVGQWRIVG